MTSKSRYDPQTHHRRSTRLKGYDYTLSGAYFVTLVTYRRDPIFGEIVAGQMKLSPLGQIVREEWLRSIGIRNEIRLYADEFVVMPNHFHGIVWIVGADGVCPGAGVTPDIGVDHDAGPQSTGEEDPRAWDGRPPCAPTHTAGPVGADGVRPDAGVNLDPAGDMDADPQSIGSEDLRARGGRTPCAPTNTAGPSERTASAPVPSITSPPVSAIMPGLNPMPEQGRTPCALGGQGEGKI